MGRDEAVKSSVGRTRLRFRDLWHESRAALAANRLRTIAAGLAVFIAAAAATVVFVLSATIAAQVSDEFDAIRATSLRVTPTKSIPPDQQVFPGDTEVRLKRIPGVVSGGVVVSDVGVKVAITNTSALRDTVEAKLIGIDESVLDATDALIDGLRVPAAFDTGARVAYLGAELADRLGVVPPESRDALDSVVMVNGLALWVAGIIRDPQRLTESVDALVVPRKMAEQLADFEPADYSLLVETLGGAASGVGVDIPLVLAPERADPYVVDVPPDANRFRRRVEGNVRALVLAMVAISAMVGAFSISSAAYSGVIERTGEFGLRRAFGAKPRHIRSQVVVETVLVAGGAGIAGESLGFAIALIVSRVNGWTAIADPVQLAWVGPAACVLGVVAGLPPSHRASRIDPSVALRQA